MKQTAKIALCGISAALAVTLMLLAYFPYFTYSVPAVAGLVMMLPVIEINGKWAVGAYAASVVPVLLLAEREAGFLYVFLLGYYPILKALIERLNRRPMEWLLKLAVFNAAVLAAYGLMSFITDLSFEDLGLLGRYGAWALLAAGNAVFVLYDIAVSRMSVLYMLRLHPAVQKIFRIR